MPGTRGAEHGRSFLKAGSWSQLGLEDHNFQGVGSSGVLVSPAQGQMTSIHPVLSLKWGNCVISSSGYAISVDDNNFSMPSADFSHQTQPSTACGSARLTPECVFSERSVTWSHRAGRSPLLLYVEGALGPKAVLGYKTGSSMSQGEK